jgi:hypothetical protein
MQTMAEEVLNARSKYDERKGIVESAGGKMTEQTEWMEWTCALDVCLMVKRR